MGVCLSQNSAVPVRASTLLMPLYLAFELYPTASDASCPGRAKQLYALLRAAAAGGTVIAAGEG